MPSATAVFFLAGWLAMGVALVNMVGIWEWAPRKVESVTVVRSDVEALIDRLNPLTKDPTSSWRGVSVTFSSAGVAIDLTLKNDSELKSKAPTLAQAVEGLAAPNAEVQAALAGWKAK